MQLFYLLFVKVADLKDAPFCLTVLWLFLNLVFFLLLFMYTYFTYILVIWGQIQGRFECVGRSIPELIPSLTHATFHGGALRACWGNISWNGCFSISPSIQTRTDFLLSDHFSLFFFFFCLINNLTLRLLIWNMYYWSELYATDAFEADMKEMGLHSYCFPMETFFF